MPVSILIPVYNREGYIGACVESALAQTVSDVEVVIVDNQSTDATWDVCQHLARQDSRIRIFQNETNLGPVRNWQRCIAEARGTIGKLLFSDDLIAPSFLEKTLPFLDDPEVGLVTTAVDVSGKVEYQWHPGKSNSRRYLWDSMFNGRLPVSPGAALLRMKDLRQNLHNFGKHGIGPDLLLLMLTARNYPAVSHLTEPLAYFRDHPGSISSHSRVHLRRGYALARVRFILSFVRTMQT